MQIQWKKAVREKSKIPQNEVLSFNVGKAGSQETEEELVPQVLTRCLVCEGIFFLFVGTKAYSF